MGEGLKGVSALAPSNAQESSAAPKRRLMGQRWGIKEEGEEERSETKENKKEEKMMG